MGRQVAISAPGDVVDVLAEQHQQLKSLFAATLRRCGPEREQAFFTLRRLIAVHWAAEAQIIRTRAERVLANGQQLALARRDEQRAVQNVVAELENLDVDTDGFVQRLNKLRKIFVDHVERQERGEFAELARETMTGGLDRVARVAEIADAVTPDGHGARLEPELRYLLVGSLAAMTERADDIISGLA